MKWQEFKSQLEENPNLHLQFQYSGNDWVRPSYHITEIKQANISSVDCGGNLDVWNEIILQVLEPKENDAENSMEVSKALKIVDLVENKLSLHPNAFVKIEFGNSNFGVRQMSPNKLETSGTNLIVDLEPETTQCKASDKGGSCGTKKSNVPTLTEISQTPQKASCCS